MNLDALTIAPTLTDFFTAKRTKEELRYFIAQLDAVAKKICFSDRVDFHLHSARLNTSIPTAGAFAALEVTRHELQALIANKDFRLSRRSLPRLQRHLLTIMVNGDAQVSCYLSQAAAEQLQTEAAMFWLGK